MIKNTSSDLSDMPWDADPAETAPMSDNPRLPTSNLRADVLAFLKTQQRAEEIALAALRKAGEGYLDGEPMKAYNERVRLIEQLEALSGDSSAPETSPEPAGKPTPPDLWNAVSHLLSHWDEHRKCFELCGTTMTELRAAFAASAAPGHPSPPETSALCPKCEQPMSIHMSNAAGTIVNQCPTVVEIPEKASTQSSGLQGSIEIGDRFIWMRGTRHEERVRVTQVATVPGDERRVFSARLDVPGEPVVWNDESRFREACERLSEKVSGHHE